MLNQMYIRLVAFMCVLNSWNDTIICLCLPPSKQNDYGDLSSGIMQMHRAINAHSFSIPTVKADLQSKTAASASAAAQSNEAPSDATTPEHAPSEPSTSQEGQGAAKPPAASGPAPAGGNGTSVPTSGTVSASGSTSGLSTGSASAGVSASGSGGLSTAGEPAPIRAPASLWRCSRIMHLLRDLRPTLLSALEGIVDQVRLHIFTYKYHFSWREFHS